MIEELQHDPCSLEVPAVAGAPMTCLPPSGDLPRVVDAGEPLVALGDDVLCLNLYRVDGWPGTVPKTYTRVAVAERLVRAGTLLPEHFSLAIFDAWRSSETVRALYDAFYGRGRRSPPGSSPTRTIPTRSRRTPPVARWISRSRIAGIR